jgi:hypothetical protein
MLRSIELERYEGMIKVILNTLIIYIYLSGLFNLLRFTINEIQRNSIAIKLLISQLSIGNQPSKLDR